HPSHLRVYSQIKTQAGLLAIAVYQSHMHQLTHRHRGQARSHIYMGTRLNVVSCLKNFSGYINILK
ncbi:hypothetical protein, partial [Pseudomonas gessardii]